MSERRARITGVIVGILGILLVIAGLFFALGVVVSSADRRASYYPADVFDFGAVAGALVSCALLFAAGALCVQRCRACMLQARAGRPLAMYALCNPDLPHACGAELLERPISCAKDADALFPDGSEPLYFEYAQPLSGEFVAIANQVVGVPAVMGMRFDIHHNKIHGIDGEGIQDVTIHAWRGTYFNVERAASRLVFTLFCETFLFCFEQDAFSIEEQRVRKEGPIDDGSRAWGNTRVRLDTMRCYRIPYVCVRAMRPFQDPAERLLLRGNRWRGIDLELDDGSTLSVEIDDRPVTDSSEVRRKRYQAAYDEVERLVNAGAKRKREEAAKSWTDSR